MRLLRVVDAELQADDDVVLHAADLAAQRYALLAKGVLRRLELHAVYAHLLLEPSAVALGVLAEDRVGHAHPLLAQHVVEQGARPVLAVSAGVSVNFEITWQCGVCVFKIRDDMAVVGRQSHFLVHDDAVALGRMVYAVPDVGQSVQGALQVLALEAEIPLALSTKHDSCPVP